MQDLILTTAQAQAVYNALRALAAVGTAHGAEFQIGGWVYVWRIQLSGAIHVQNREDGEAEGYADQAEFAAAYGLHDAPDGADLLAALKVAHMALVDYPPAPRNSFTDAATEMCRATIARNSA